MSGGRHGGRLRRMERAVADRGGPGAGTPLAPIQLKALVYLGEEMVSPHEVAVQLRRDWLAGRRDEWPVVLEPVHAFLLEEIGEPVPAEVVERIAVAEQEAREGHARRQAEIRAQCASEEEFVEVAQRVEEGETLNGVLRDVRARA